MASAKSTAPSFGGAGAASPPHMRVAIVGAGFSGLGLAIRLKRRGINNFVVSERGGARAGAWRAALAAA